MSSAYLKQKLTEYLLYCVKNDNTLAVEEVLPMTLVWAALRQTTNADSRDVPNFADIFEALANVDVTRERYNLVMQILRRFELIPPPLSCEEKETLGSVALKLVANTNFTSRKLSVIAGRLQIETFPASFADYALDHTIAKVSQVLYEKQEDIALVKQVIELLEE